jgi:hypothetical protein
MRADSQADILLEIIQDKLVGIVDFILVKIGLYRLMFWTIMRTFERTHPWISFRIDLRKAAPSLWLLLGEAASKCEHIAGVPLRPSVAQSLHQWN